MIRRVGPRFSKLEIKELTKAWAALSLAFTIMVNRTNLLSTESLVTFVVSGVIVGTAFLLHEMGHKFVAQKYGLWAEFRAYDQGLVLAIVMAFFGFLFAAPGAVMIRGYTSLSRIGKISAAGPLVNFVLAGLFLLFGWLNPYPLLGILFSYGASINAFLGLFNLIPFAVFDGRKIFAWSRWRWGLMVAIGFGLTAVSWGMIF